MIISTKGRYILRVMIDLAERCDDGYIPMRDVAERQEISLKYLEKILPVLTKNNMIEGVHGKGGGYRLTRRPADYSVGEILRLTEGDLAPAAGFWSAIQNPAAERRNAGPFRCGRSLPG